MHLHVLLLSVMLQTAPTLGSELLERNLPAPPDAADLDQTITSYAVLDDQQWFVIGYYHTAQDALLHELQVRSLDKRAGVWRRATFDAIGSVLSLTRHNRFIYLRGHGSPSSGRLLVLIDDLGLRHTLDGWPEQFMEDGRVVFQRNMRPFQPSHAGVLALYDPVADRESPLFPDRSVDNDRGFERVQGSDLAIDRSFGPVEKGDVAGSVQFDVVTQKIRLTRTGGEPAGPETRHRVTCDLTRGSPDCRRARSQR